MSTTGKTNSIVLTEGPSRAAARAMLRGVGFTRDDLRKPIIGIANTWTEIGPCNYHLRDIAAAVKEGIRAAGGTPMEFNSKIGSPSSPTRTPPTFSSNSS